MSVHDLPGAEISRQLLREAPPMLDEAPLPDEPPEDGEKEIAELVQTYEVGRELARLRVRDAARRLFTAEQAGQVNPPAPVALPSLLAEPDEVTDYRVDRLWPAGGRVILAAQYKSGKTTLIGNLVRCLVDGEPFLGSYSVTRPAGQVVILDTEMPRGKLRHWLRDQRIATPQRVTVIPLRGRVASFNLLDPAVRAKWVATMCELGTSVLILDCLRPVLDSLGLDESHDTGRVLVALDELAEAAEVAEFAIVHHMGHTGERARGDSRLRDWPDVEWRIVRADDDPGSPRFFTAYGRDVDLPETALEFDPATRRLTAASGSRKDATVNGAARAVLELLSGARETGMSGRAIEDALMHAGHARSDIRAAIKQTKDDGRVSTQPGPRGAVLHHLVPTLDDLIENSSAPARRSAPQRTGEVVRQCASASIEAHCTTHSTGTEQSIDPGALNTGDVTPDALTCHRCRYPADRLIPGPGGIQLCKTCAYPAGGAPDDDAEE